MKSGTYFTQEEVIFITIITKDQIFAQILDF